MVSARYELLECERGYEVVVGDEVIAKVVPGNLASYLNARRKIMKDFREEILDENEVRDLMGKVYSTLDEDQLLRLYKFMSECRNLKYRISKSLLKDLLR